VRLHALGKGQLVTVVRVRDGVGFTVTSTTVNVVDGTGAARPVFAIEPTDVLLQSCVLRATTSSPSARETTCVCTRSGRGNW
jgi:hypothetical protein